MRNKIKGLSRGVVTQVRRSVITYVVVVTAIRLSRRIRGVHRAP